MSSQDALTRDDEIDIGGVFSALGRRWWVIVLVAICSAVGLFFFLSSLDEKYLSTARILVKDGSDTFTRTTGEANAIGPRNPVDEQAVGSEVEIVQSDKLITEVIQRLSLINEPEFSEEINETGFIDKILGRQKRPIVELEGAVLELIKERLDVYSIENSRVIVVEFWAHRPRLAQQIVAELTSAYLDFKVNEQNSTEESATDWLDPRIKELEADVEEAEASVADYRAREGLLRVDDQNALLATQQLSEASTELSRLKSERAATQARVSAVKQAISDGASLDSVPEVLDSAIVQSLREREAALQGEVSDLSVTLLSGHPRLKSANSQLAQVRGQLRVAAQDVVKSLERDVAATRRAEMDLEIEIERLKEKASEMEGKLVELRARERQAETARELLTEYRSRFLEATTRSDLNQANVEIISPASFPNEAFFPKVVPFTAAGTVGVTMLAVLAIIAGSLLTTTTQAAPVRQEPVAVTQPAVDMHGSSPAGQENRNDMVTGNAGEMAPATGMSGQASAGMQPTQAPAHVQTAAQPQTMAQNAYAQVGGQMENTSQAGQASSEQVPVSQLSAANQVVSTGAAVVSPSMVSPQSLLETAMERNQTIGIRYATDALLEHGDCRIAVISPGGQKGSVTACLLARHLARRKKRVLIIDFAAGATTTAEMTGTSNMPGFFNVASGTVPIEQCIYKDQKSQARIMPGGHLFPGLPVPSVETISDLVDTLSENFDYVVLDNGWTEIENINIVADEDTVAVVSPVKASDEEVNELVESLEYDGYELIVRAAPQKEDLIFQKRQKQAA